MKILIIKTSSLGDILQSLLVLSYLHDVYPDLSIDWIAEKEYVPWLSKHPLIRDAILCDFRHNRFRYPFWKSLLALRKTRYDLVIDLQGNAKSGLITLFAKAKRKLGFAIRSAPEWINILSTNRRFNIDQARPIQEQYLSLVEQYTGVQFRDVKPALLESEPFTMPFENDTRIMVCAGSAWPNKQLKQETLLALLKRFEDAAFLIVWGCEKEKSEAEALAACLTKSVVIGNVSIPKWQNMMQGVDLVITMDSAALHLCATTETPSLSFFGPSSSMVYKPKGAQHKAYQGNCPYGVSFTKRCPQLRTCKTGACIKDLSHFLEDQNLCDSLQQQSLH